eukprot:361474-Chlamydomonas_euryale.AAC.2
MSIWKSCCNSSNYLGHGTGGTASLGKCGSIAALSVQQRLAISSARWWCANPLACGPSLRDAICANDGWDMQFGRPVAGRCNLFDPGVRLLSNALCKDKGFRQNTAADSALQPAVPFTAHRIPLHG